MNQEGQMNSVPPDLSGPFQGALGLPSATCDAMKSFFVLANTRSLSETVSILGITRQTVRRHINLLEMIRGTVLFTAGPGGYQLSETGRAEYRVVSKIINQTSRWAAGLAAISPVLDLCNGRGPNGGYYLSQQHPVSELILNGPAPMKRIYKAWVEGGGQVEAPSFRRVKAELLMYREHHGGWMCVHAGDRAALATWLGPVWGKSLIGVQLTNDPVSGWADEYVLQAYQQAVDSGECRYDHLAVTLGRGPDGEPEGVCYQRLLMPCRLPDGSPVVAVFCILTNRIDIGLLPDQTHHRMPEHFESLHGD